MRSKLSGPRAARGLFALAALLALSASLASCASLVYKPRPKAVIETLALIDAGGVGAIKGLSEPPFLYDGEILLRKADVDALWTNLAAAGFKLGPLEIVSIESVTLESSKLFSTSMDVRSYFASRLDGDYVIATVESMVGRYYFILGRRGGGYARIQGMKGPVK